MDSIYCDIYTKYLITEPKRASWNKLSEILDVDHKQINRFLLNYNSKPYNLFLQIKPYMILEWWTLSVDDQVEDKEFSKIGKADCVGRFRSWRHHAVVIWIDLVTLYYTDPKWSRFAVNRRVVDENDHKSKNDYFIEMLEECLTWWIKPSMITWDCWYASEKNLNFITRQWIWFLFGLKSNRLVKIDSKEYKPVSLHSIPKQWVIGFIKWVWYAVTFENDGNYYIYRDNYKTNDKADVLRSITRNDFEIVHAKHWNIEEYHRALKQLCNMDKHFLRNKACILSHTFFSIRAYCILEVNRILWKIKNVYELARTSLKTYISEQLNTLKLNGLEFVL